MTDAWSLRSDGVDRRQVTLGLAVGLTAAALPASAASTGPALTVDARTQGAPLDHYWSRCVGAGRAAEGLRAGWLEQLAFLRGECGFRYCRFHGLFHDDMFVLNVIDGRDVYNWQYVDDLFDRMLAIGVRPFVELGFLPKPLAANPGTVFWWNGNSAPPTDVGRWTRLVEEFVRHILNRYGADEVRGCYFEVWNEPNLNSFWHGTRSQYFALYRATAFAIKAIDPGLRVGGPATSNFVGDERFNGEAEDLSKHRTHLVDAIDTLPWRGVWIEAFLDFCRRERVPVDFVSAHPYPTDFALTPGTRKNEGRTRRVESTTDDMRWLRATVKKSAFPNAEIHLTEWSSSPSSRDATHDHLQAAAFILKANLDSIELAQSLSYWTFNDIFEERGGPPSAFHGGFGLVNFQGLPKPSFHAYRMLNGLGDRLLHRREGLAITRHTASDRLAAVAYNYPPDVREALSFGGVRRRRPCSRAASRGGSGSLCTAFRRVRASPSRRWTAGMAT